ncbi:MAG TPA: crosslink repair DNA glycosylase YcaQ family protein [Armatimonadota bacterium]|nr:crosslink repair DNA glycosylase YcaQ family protein [Armatimonadota bacterium]
MSLSKEVIFAERLRRQRLLKPVKTRADYLALFSLLQPVSPPYFSYPGSPPSMTHRAVSDMELAERFRERRGLVKGRFLNKTIGYVLADDLELYANAFCRPLGKMTTMQRRVYDALATAGPLTPRQISEETDLLNKEVMPGLHRLQEAFLVYEDQLTTDWERGWYLFGSEWPEITIEKERWEPAGSEVLLRFLTGHVFATTRQIKDWSGWAVKDLNRLLAGLEARDAVVPITIRALGEGWLRPEDANLPADPVPPTVFMLHRADPLVRSHVTELRERYRGIEVLQYLLIDGAFQGAVSGHWRIGPHDVEDIIVDLSRGERAGRKAEIMQAVAWKYHLPSHRILRYAGEPLAA